MSIRFVPYRRIDRQAWDDCLATCINPLPYALSWYLDLVTAKRWDALVMGDYEAVMPLPYNRKLLGVKQIYQPLLCQQLGVFARDSFGEDLVQRFIAQIPKRYWRVHFCMNAHGLSQSTFKRQANFILPLDAPYADLASRYADNHRRNIKKAQKNSLVLSDTVAIPDFLARIQAYHQQKGNAIPQSLYPLAQAIIDKALNEGCGLFHAAYNSDKELLAAIFYLRYRNRYINLLNVTTDLGREQRAMPFLIDAFIQTHANEATILDFEGSSIPDLARFYAGFGAMDEGYFAL